jgi:membrane protein implicated in regulation of membrane protease activity
MKLSDGFDARRLRPRNASNWRSRLGAAFATLLATLGVLLCMAGVAALFGQHSVLGPLNDSAIAAGLFAAFGLILLYFGTMLWRRCRRRSRHSSDLNMAPHLLKKRD